MADAASAPDNPGMKLAFTKMQGAGNDFVVLDATRQPVELSPEWARRLGDRRFGVGADQILLVENADAPGIDFRYRIFNNSGEEVEHCGNGARCFLRYVRDRGLTSARRVRVQTVNRVLELFEQDDGRVTVDMGAPVFAPDQVPFDTAGLQPLREGTLALWPLVLPVPADGTRPPPCQVGVVSMGNPHAVWRVDDLDTADVPRWGPVIESHPRFAQRVNAGFLQPLSRSEVRLRVYERGAGETLACGTGACAAVVVGIAAGWLDSRVDVHTRGGLLTIEWAGGQAPVLMTGPAEFVFDGEITL
jgi:diaminopimelate epimerase